ncbi:hypothetical protein V6N12_003148 [Hibiscus sabdariffa]|uniref:Uncharacterized protein n=1 Tax=Hibiscus sabdariffa TaxID=183260 RepID=A0ABR2EBI2_9ROSI
MLIYIFKKRSRTISGGGTSKMVGLGEAPSANLASESPGLLAALGIQMISIAQAQLASNRIEVGHIPCRATMRKEGGHVSPITRTATRCYNQCFDGIWQSSCHEGRE